MMSQSSLGASAKADRATHERSRVAPSPPSVSVPCADFTVADVLAWARTKPTGDAYDYMKSRDCALCQFLRDTGRAERPRVIPQRYTDDSGDHELPEWADCVSLGAGEAFNDDVSERWTFGRLVKRLEALCPETPATPSNWLTIDAYLTDELAGEQA